MALRCPTQASFGLVLGSMLRVVRTKFAIQKRFRMCSCSACANPKVQGMPAGDFPGEHDVAKRRIFLPVISGCGALETNVNEEH